MWAKCRGTPGFSDLLRRPADWLQQKETKCLIVTATSCDSYTVANQGSSLDTQCSGFFFFKLGASYLNTLFLELPKSQTPRRKADVEYKPHCLHKQFRHSESLLTFKWWWGHSQNQNSLMSAIIWPFIWWQYFLLIYLHIWVTLSHWSIDSLVEKSK